MPDTEKYLDSTGLAYYHGRLKNIFQQKETGKGLSTNDYTTAEKNKLAGIEAAAEVNQNAFGHVKAGTSIMATTLDAGSESDTFEIHAGNFITVSGTEAAEGANGYVTITAVPPIQSIKTRDGTVMPVNNHAASLDLDGDDITYKVGAQGSSNDVTVTGALDELYTMSESFVYINEISAVGFSGSYNDLIDKPTIPSAGTGSSYPVMDGTRSLGSQAGYARVDHVHPTDTSRAPLVSPAFSGTPTTPNLTSSSGDTQIVNKKYVEDRIADVQAGSAMFKGIAVGVFAPTDYRSGWYYVVGTGGATIGSASGEACEAGDMIYCISDYSSSFKASDWNVVQKNVDMSLYWAKSELTAMTTAEIDALFAA